MSLLDTFLSVIVPHECLSCGNEGALACERCIRTLPPAERCYLCRQFSQGVICESCSPRNLAAIHAIAQYKGLAVALVHHLKYSGAQAAAKPMALAMQATVRQTLPSADAIVPVPTAASRVRQRGYDQATLLARELSRQSGLPHSKALQRLGRTQQVGASRQQRLHQLSGAFVVKLPPRLKGAHLLIIDDVLTTGATLESAAHALLTAGAGTVSALVFAVA